MSTLKNNNRWITFLQVILICFLLAIAVKDAYPSHLSKRPITTNGGQILQSYLYGGQGIHKGVDFPYPLDTSIYAVADGKVVDLLENSQDNDNTSLWGNYVVIQHTRRHFNRLTTQMSYTYSVYLHLSYNSVPVSLNQQVTAGQKIGEIDNTGQLSDGNHLHLQIVVYPLASQTLTSLDVNNNSRNPELWLEPYSNNTTMAIGKVLDPNNINNPLAICGLQKPYGSFPFVRTYSDSSLHEDDILGENFATTDISPGTYHLYAYDYVGTNTCNDPNNQILDLGNYTFKTGEATYIGLYPVYLPDVRQETGNWNSYIQIRNNHSSDSTQAIVTYFDSGGWVNKQETLTIPKQGNARAYPPNNFGGSVLIVADQDIAATVVQEMLSGYGAGAYTGVGKPDKQAFVPLVHRNNVGWYSYINIQNASNRENNVEIDFFRSTEGQDCTKNFTLPPYGVQRINTDSSNYNCLEASTGGKFVGSAHIAAEYPVAVSNTQYTTGTTGYHRIIMSSSATQPATAHEIPLIQNNNYGYLSGMVLQNSDTTTMSMPTVTYYPASGGSNCGTQSLSSISSYKSIVVLPIPPTSGTNCTSSVVSAAFPTNRIGLGQVNQLKNQSDQASGYEATTNVTKTAIAPWVVRNWNGWGTGIQIRNTENGSATATISLYNSSGSLATSWAFNLSPYSTYTISDSQFSGSSFDGSAVISANRKIAVAVNLWRPGNSGDILTSYLAVNR